MKKIFSITAILVLLSFAFVTFSDAFFCQENEESAQSQLPCGNCCVQCCPSHNLVLQKKLLVQAQVLPSPTQFLPPTILDCASTLLIKSIFHPPKLAA